MSGVLRGYVIRVDPLDCITIELIITAALFQVCICMYVYVCLCLLFSMLVYLRILIAAN